jgi:hypothetical protein
MTHDAKLSRHLRRARAKQRWCAIDLLLAGLAAAACLPEDTRAPPGRLLVTVSADEALVSGIATVDGWQVTYERFLLSLANLTMGGPDCDLYSDQFYARIVDLQQPGPHRVKTQYALGECDFGFHLGAPPEDYVRGAGVTEDDEAFMRAQGRDAFAQGGVVLYAAGTATRGGVVLHFGWLFRQMIDYRCGVRVFSANSSETVDIRMQAAVLFQDGLDDAAAELRFDAYAGADADGDGEILLEELQAVPLVNGGEFPTLAARLYRGLVPRLPRVPGVDACLMGLLRRPDQAP